MANTAVVVPDMIAAVALHGPYRPLTSVQPVVKWANIAVTTVPSACNRIALEAMAIPNFDFGGAGVNQQ
ncbi:hypothetical protein BGZ75_007876, partial [Mortierella antarctica]